MPKGHAAKFGLDAVATLWAGDRERKRAAAQRGMIGVQESDRTLLPQHEEREASDFPLPDPLVSLERIASWSPAPVTGRRSTRCCIAHMALAALVIHAQAAVAPSLHCSRPI